MIRASPTSVGWKESNPMESLKAAQVVFVDDEPEVCGVVCKMLARAGADAQCFSCARIVSGTWRRTGATC